jgi:hypothetical protein
LSFVIRFYICCARNSENKLRKGLNVPPEKTMVLGGMRTCKFLASCNSSVTCCWQLTLEIEKFRFYAWIFLCWFRNKREYYTLQLNVKLTKFLSLFLLTDCVSTFNWFLYDAVNPNKASIRQLPLFIFYSHSLHVSAPTGHPQVRYTIRCLQGLFLLQWIRCTYTT